MTWHWFPPFEFIGLAQRCISPLSLFTEIMSQLENNSFIIYLMKSHVFYLCVEQTQSRCSRYDCARAIKSLRHNRWNPDISGETAYIGSCLFCVWRNNRNLRERTAIISRYRACIATCLPPKSRRPYRRASLREGFIDGIARVKRDFRKYRDF